MVGNPPRILAGDWWLLDEVGGRRRRRTGLWIEAPLGVWIEE
jgi:hypothetical protein